MSHIFNKNDWIKYGRWTQPPLSGYFWCPWNLTKGVKEITPEISFDSLAILDGYVLGTTNNCEMLYRYISEIDSRGEIKEFTDKFEKHALDCEKSHLHILYQDKSDLNQYLSTLYNTYQEAAGVWWLAFAIADEAQRLILEKNLATSEEDLLQKLEPLHQETWLEARIRKLRDIDEGNLADHVKEFEWYGTHHWMGEPYTLLKAKESLEEIRKDNKAIKEVSSENEAHPLLALLARMAY
jgi:hypothetical protein